LVALGFAGGFSALVALAAGFSAFAGFAGATATVLVFFALGADSGAAVEHC
jgi:hypothetical protein